MGGDFANAVVIAISHDEIPRLVDSEPRGFTEVSVRRLSVGVSIGRTGCIARDVKHNIPMPCYLANTVVATISHIDVAISIQRHFFGAMKRILTVATSSRGARQGGHAPADH